MEQHPMEVAGFAMALSISWTVFISGLLGDFVRFSSWMQWIIPSFLRNDQKNWAWFHAFFCIVAGAALFAFWRRVVLQRMAMGIEEQADAIRREKETLPQKAKPKFPGEE